jgi:hypothetical protein
MANEKLPSKLLLQISDPCAYGRLTDVQPLRRADKTSGRNDLEKGPGEFNIHASISHRLSSVALPSQRRRGAALFLFPLVF